MQKLKFKGYDMKPLKKSTQMPFDLAFVNSEPAAEFFLNSLLHFPLFTPRERATETSRKSYGLKHCKKNISTKHTISKISSCLVTTYRNWRSCVNHVSIYVYLTSNHRVIRSWRWGSTPRSRRWPQGTKASRSSSRCSRTRERVRKKSVQQQWKGWSEPTPKI